MTQARTCSLDLPVNYTDVQGICKFLEQSSKMKKNLIRKKLALKHKSKSEFESAGLWLLLSLNFIT